MNFEKVRRKNRKAISPVLATVILIAITLIAAVAIAGFVFGLFGSFTSSAQVSAQITACHSSATNDTCFATLTNSGTSNANAQTCSINVAGSSQAGVIVGAPAIGASNSAKIRCYVAGVGMTVQTAGSQAIGSFSLSNGASVPFSGVWS